MIYTFITNKDIDVSIKDYFLGQITTGVAHVLKKAEAAAFSLIKSKLNSRYDLTKLFPVIKEWDIAKPYLKDSYACKDDVIYKALSDNTGNTPDDVASAYWVEEDPRDGLLIVHCVNITVYYTLKRINPRKLSQETIDSYHEAVDWLDDVNGLRENPDFPLIDDVIIGGMEVRSGSNEKLDHYY